MIRRIANYFANIIKIPAFANPTVFVVIQYRNGSIVYKPLICVN